MTPQDGSAPLAILAHSLLPRGGVVHALQLAEALAGCGCRVDLLAPALPGQSLFRAPRVPGCRFIPVPATATPRGDVRALVTQRLKDWDRYFNTNGAAAHYALFHAQDSISANALADQVVAGRIPAYIRTVHHLDDFADAQLDAWQSRGVTSAAQLLCVSERWRDVLAQRYTRDTMLVSNGVDRQRFAPDAIAGSSSLPPGIPAHGTLFLSIGGIEARKNTLNALCAFQHYHRRYPDARWVIAGGASLLDHDAFARQFHTALRAAGFEVGREVLLPGLIDDAAMPALFRRADALLFASLTEGFGLVVLEALACGTPVVTSQIAPFTAYLSEASVEWADPHDPAAIAAAMVRAVHAPAHRYAARQQAGFDVASRHTWARSAQQHIACYAAVLKHRADSTGAGNNVALSKMEISHA